eukprot:5644864-Ditylum_brightwellii.AAC.2
MKEVNRLCGGEERIRHNVELIKSVLGIGGGIFAGYPPERLKLFQECLRAVGANILVAEYRSTDALLGQWKLWCQQDQC